jgi:hypothetical protein
MTIDASCRPGDILASSRGPSVAPALLNHGHVKHGHVKGSSGSTEHTPGAASSDALESTSR